MGDVGVDRESPSPPSSVHVCVPPVVVWYVEGKGCMNCRGEDEYENGGEDEEDGGDEEDEGAGEGKGCVKIGVEADVDTPMEEEVSVDGDGKSLRNEWVRKESVSLETNVVGVLCTLDVNLVGVVCTLNVGVAIIPPPPEGEGKVADLPGRVVVVVVPPANQLELVNAEPTPTALNVNTGLCSLPCCPEIALLAVDVGVGLPAGDDSNDPELDWDWDIQEVVMCG